MSASARRDTERLLRKLPEGWTAVPARRGGHTKVYDSRGAFVTTAAGTPRGGRRGLANLKATIRRRLRAETHEDR